MKLSTFANTLLAALIGCAAATAFAETKPLGQWVFEKSHLEGDTVKDLAGNSPAKIAKVMPLVKAGETEAMQFDGGANTVAVAKDSLLSAIKKNFTAEAWVKLNDMDRWSRFIGIMARQQEQRKGWLIGTHYHRFVFSLITPEGTTDLHSGGSAHPGHWYHIVGTYDGETMKLYVNGLLVAQSKERKGDALLPTDTPLSMVDYHDGAEFYPLRGMLNETRVYDRVLDEKEIREHYLAKSKQLEASPPLEMSGCFSDHMLLQAGMKLPVWGRTLPGDEVTVACAGQEKKVKADDAGRWRVDLDKLEAGGQHEMVISTPRGKITYKDVLVGEVWFCAGQSNMAWGTRRTAAYALAQKPLPQIRLFTNVRESEIAPAEFTGGWWEVCDAASSAEFAGVGFAFGHRLHQELKTPIGMFNASWGGTPVESWISRDEIRKLPEMEAIVAKDPEDKWERSGLYNKMVHPLVPYAIRGVVWYQGEGNVGNANLYEKRFSTMIADWRARWGQGDFPVYYVQIAPFNYGGHWNICCAELWDAQRRCLKTVPNTGMAIATDATNIGDNHASDKLVIGERLALWALANTYGRKGFEYSGPLYRNFKVEGDKIRVFFDHAEGLKARNDKPLDWFTIAGEDREFKPAEVKIETAKESGLDEDTLVIHSAELKSPVAVRFAWSGIAQPNFVNKAGLPASPFRTDEWPSIFETLPKKE